MSWGAPRRLKRSAVEQQAASINVNRSAPFMTLSDTKRQRAVASETSWDRVSLLNLGHRDGEAPVVPSLERVQHKERAPESPIFFITLSATPSDAEQFILWQNKPGTLLQH